MPDTIDRPGARVRELNDECERLLDEVRTHLRAGEPLDAVGVAGVLERTLDELFLADYDATRSEEN